MKKVLPLFSIAAGLSMAAMSASASLPKGSGLETVNIHGTLMVQLETDKVKNVSVSNKDILGLISNEYPDVTFPKGAQLVIYGLGSSTEEQFAVVTANGESFVINNASENFDADDEYSLFFEPDEDENVTTSFNENSETESFVLDQSELFYRDSSGDNTFFINGLTKATVTYDDKDNESFNMSNGNGSFDMPILGIGEDQGVVTGGISGSGKDVDDVLFD